MLCKVCNKEVEAGLKTCPYCGAQMENSEAEIVSIKFTRKKAQPMPKEGEKSTPKKKRSGISKKNLQDEAPITVIEDPTLFEEEEVKDYDPNEPVILVFDEPEVQPEEEEPVAEDENPISVEEPEEPEELVAVEPEDDETLVVLGEEGNVYAKEEPVEEAPAEEEPVAEEPVEEAPVEEEPVAEEPAEEAPVEEEPVAEEPVEEAPVEEEPVAEEPVEEAPVEEEPVAEEPVEEAPAEEEPVAEEPVEEYYEEPVAEEPVEEAPIEEEPVVEELYEEEMPKAEEEEFLPEEIIEEEMPEPEPAEEIYEEPEEEIAPVVMAVATVEEAPAEEPVEEYYEEPVEEEPVEEAPAEEEPVAEEPVEEEPIEEIPPEPEYFEEQEEPVEEPQEEAYEATYEGYYQEPADDYYQYDDPTVVEQAEEEPIEENIKKKYKLPKPPKKDKVNFFWFLIALLCPPYPGIMLWITKSVEQPRSSRVYGAEAIIMYIIKRVIRNVVLCVLMIAAIAGILVGAFYYIQSALAQAGYMIVLPWMM